MERGGIGRLIKVRSRLIIWMLGMVVTYSDDVEGRFVK